LVPTLTGSGDAVLPFALAGVAILLFFLLRPRTRLGEEREPEIRSA